ncbi:MAG: hypothetical protein NVSMB59_23200 [Vulcanimicrobiaceae bacterium]
MTAYQEALRERAEIRAARARAKGEASVAQARKMGDIIPFGQPILVGHHSEKGDRRYRSRINRKYDVGFGLIKEAERLDDAAAHAGTSISSDDPDAIAALTEKLAKLEKIHALMKKANPLIKKGKRDGLLALGFSEGRVDQLFKPDFCGRIGFPAFELSNSNANIKRVRERIAHLQKQAVAVAMDPISGDGWTLSEDVEDNRIVIDFAEKPERAMLDALRAAGFKWSPTRGTHIRQRSNGAIYAAKRLLGLPI